MLKKIVQSPYLNLLSGLVLLITSGSETWNLFDELVIGAHHGILIFSIIQIVKTIPEILQGLKEVDESRSQ
ncbi:MAG: hypothetical protein HRT38_13830 [Alteromonadaceae bacterium]|nr:hypothetical protein [Alteromonadaceae bacterium]